MRFLFFVFCLVVSASASYAKPQVTAARIGAHPEKTRFVMELTEAPAYQIFTFPDPFRVVIDLPELDWQLPPNKIPRQTGVIEDLRFGQFSAGTSRVVLDVKAPVRVDRVRVLPPQGKMANHRLVLDLVAISHVAFRLLDRRPIASAVATA